MNTRPSVLLATEGTYPFHRGGVSTWCHALTQELREIPFTLLAVTMHPYLERQYTLAPNVREVIQLPLWGTEDPAEYGNHRATADYLQRRWDTSDRDIESEYVPVYESFVREIVEPHLAHRALGIPILGLNQFLTRCDYDRVQGHRALWETFVAVARDGWRRQHPDAAPPSLADLRDAWRLLYRLMLPLSLDPPRTDIVHSAAAAFCGLPCVVSKLRWGTPYLLTEHGVYLREQYLNIGRSTKSPFVRWFLFRLVNAVVGVNYAFADQISPVCQYNTRWERWRNVEPARIRVIYNGVDPERFEPEPRTEPARPTVVCMGLIFPLKGQLDLIDAALLVRKVVPDVEFKLYGSPSDEQYYAECRARVATHGLERHVTFAGTTNEPAAALRAAHVVALPSISEAFPYALVEAMLTGSAIVATDVGGVREALDSTGLLVGPHEPAALAEAIALLLRWPEGRRRLGNEARQRALQWFTEQRFVGAYRATYRALVGAEPTAAPAPSPHVEQFEAFVERRRKLRATA